MKHLVDDDRNEDVLGYVSGIENVVNLDNARCGCDAGEHSLDDKAPGDIGKLVAEEFC